MRRFPEPEIDPETCQHDDLEPADHEVCGCGSFGSDCTGNFGTYSFGTYSCGGCQRKWADCCDRWNCRNCGGLIEHGKLLAPAVPVPLVAPAASRKKIPAGTEITSPTLVSLSDADKVSLLRSLATTLEQALATGVNPAKLPKLAEVREVLRLTGTGPTEWPKKKSLCGLATGAGMCAKDNGHAGRHTFVPVAMCGKESRGAGPCVSPPEHAGPHTYAGKSNGPTIKFTVFHGTAVWRMCNDANKDTSLRGIILVQQALAWLGFDPKWIDGKWGPASTTAWSNFLASRGHGSLYAKLTEEGLLVLQEAIEEAQGADYDGRAPAAASPPPVETPDDDRDPFEFDPPAPAQVPEGRTT